MPRITIDSREVDVAPGATLLDAARQLGIEIPTLCHREGHPPLTSCFVCVVRVQGYARLLPSCATQAAEDMVVESETEEVRGARRTALELLLSDHLGDCQGPCQVVCPAHMDIPTMIRQIAAGRLRDALITVKERIPLPATLGRICPELCEKGCRRAQRDGAVSICLLKRHVADADLASGEPYLPPCAPPSGKRVAIVGAGPAGLAAAYYLQQEGHACTLFDAHEKPGGMLQYEVAEEKLPRDVLDAEIALIRRLGAEFRLGVRVGEGITLDDLRRDYDAVLVAVGPVAQSSPLGLEVAGLGIKVQRHTQATGVTGVFAAGSAVTPSRHAVRAVGEGRVAARSISLYLAGQAVSGAREFNVRMGKLAEGEIDTFVARASDEGRVAPTCGRETGLAIEEAAREALRCLGCDCAKLESCRLRQQGTAYEASTTRYGGERRPYQAEETHPDVVYEPGKCISCGICVQIASESQEELGLTFVGRGFSVRVGVPFSEELSEGLRRVARACAEACPTAALSLKARG